MALPFGLETLNIKCKSGKAKILGTIVCVGGALLLTLYKGKPLFDVSHYESAAPASAAMRSAMKQGSSSPPTRIIEKWSIGVIALILGTLFWSSWFILQSNIGKMYPCRYSSTAIMTLFGAIQSAILAFSTGRDLSMWIPNGKIQILTVLYSGMVGSGLCYVGMSWCVKKRGPVFTAAFSPLVQIMSAMIDIPVLHEQLHLGSVLGSMLVMVGLYILLWVLHMGDAIFGGGASLHRRRQQRRANVTETESGKEEGRRIEGEGIIYEADQDFKIQEPAALFVP
ncbi:hypothetical protein PIB30_007780 [Stylosanthes scabra]|uniref:WAT1-related protein n=1 Tax=Stylosanthes scabra TaxID=79078 RepID=A0ABU6Z2D8_9FABA|nr:hypothetical protein [Stylosanthes scabra]